MDTTADLDASATGLVTEVMHPLVQHKLGLLRDTTTTTQMFRQLVNELTLLLTYEATKDLADEEIEIETPLERTAARRISGKKVAVCPILRAGMGMLDAVLSLVPGARVSFIGLFRDEETLEPVEYFVKLPGDIADRDVILLDPMLATGNSTAAAVETVKRAGATSVRLIALIAAPEGIDACTASTRTCTSLLHRSTAGSTRRATSFPASVTQATGSTERSSDWCSTSCVRRPKSSTGRSSRSSSSCS